MGKQMSRDKILGIVLSTISLAIAVLASIYFVFVGGSVPLTAFAWPALGFILGMAIVFFSFVQAGMRLDDEIEQFPQLIEDDIGHLRSGTITSTHIMTAGTLLAAIIQAGILLWFGKIYASWGPFNVLFVALLVVALTLVWSIRSDWFQNRKQRLSARIFWIPAAGWLICILLGSLYAEPREYGGRSQLERSQAAALDGNPNSRGSGNSYVFLRTADMAGEAIADFDCDDEACLVVLLLVVVVVSILATATIPHFWVVATMLLLTFMGVIALRELLYTDDY